MMNIGKTIADLRKANNMTQSEVADILGVSYQAVSKWERDESLPDITMLPKIADLYHISIDQLLRGGFEMKPSEIEQAKEIIDEAVMDDEKADEAFNEKITKLVSEHSHKTEGDNDSQDITDMISNYVSSQFTKAFENMAPFMKPDKINKIIKRRKPKISIISKNAFEFLDDETIDHLIDSMDEVDEETVEYLIELLPRCSRRVKDRIVTLIVQSDVDVDVEDLLPFLSQSQIQQLLAATLENSREDKIIDNVAGYMPFLNSESKDMILNMLIEKDDANADLEEFMPFLNSAQKSRLVDWAIDRVDMEELADLAPFLNSETLCKIIDHYIDEDKQEDITGFYPFLNSKAKKKLAEYYVREHRMDELDELLDYLKK